MRDMKLPQASHCLFSYVGRGLGSGGEVLDGYWGRMRDGLAVIAACAALMACTPPPDTANWPISLPPPYNTWPPAPPGTPIEPGRPVGLNGSQQEAVATGVLKWMKQPISVRFRGIEAVQTVAGGHRVWRSEWPKLGGQCHPLAVRWRTDGTGWGHRFRRGRDRLVRP